MLPDVLSNALRGRESSESERRDRDNAQLLRSFILKAIQTGKPIVREGLTKSGAAGGSCDG